MQLRRLIFWSHLLIGVTVGVVVLVMCVTGVLLTYEKQLMAWAERGMRSAPPPPNTPRLAVESLLTQLLEQNPSLVPTGITLYSDPNRPALVAATPGTTVYVDPYTGALLAQGSPAIRAFFQSVTNWHRYFGASAANRATGKSVNDASNLLFLFIVVSGIYLWWPRKVIWFQRGLLSKARNWNWHNTFGSWSSIPLFFIVLSGVIMSYPWANNLLYRLTGNEPPAAQVAPEAGRQGAGGRGSLRQTTIPVDGLNALWATAEQQEPDWQSINMRLSPSIDMPVTFTIDRGNGGQPDKRSTLILDRRTASVVRSERFSDQNLGRRLRSLARFTHTGEAFGWIGQTVAGIASFGGVMLVWTGAALVIRRFRSWIRNREKLTPHQAEQLAGVTSSAFRLVNDKEAEQ
jgi:uncharacterized iron-regulated membrane protein